MEVLEATEKGKGNGWERQKIRRLGRELEMKERRERRKNIIIKEMEVQGKNIKEEVEEWMREKLGIVQVVRKVEKLILGTNKQGKKIEGLLIRVQDLEKKKEIMINRKNLKGTNMFIDDDLTKKEREIQKIIRERADEERKKGNKTRIGYQMLEVNRVWMKWQENEEEFKNVNFRIREKRVREKNESNNKIGKLEHSRSKEYNGSMGIIYKILIG